MSAKTAGATAIHPGAGSLKQDERRGLSLLYLTILALLLGIVTGLGAVLFRDLISLLHNLFFAGRFDLTYDANIFTAPSRWGAFIILAPVVGAVIVTVSREGRAARTAVAAAELAG